MDGSLKIIERLQTELTTATDTDTISRLTRYVEALEAERDSLNDDVKLFLSDCDTLTRESEQANEKGELMCSAHGAALIEISRITKELDHESGLLAVARKWVEKWQKEDPMVKDLLELRRAIAKRKAGA